MKILWFVLFMCGASVALAAQSSASAGWDGLKHLRQGTHVHVLTDSQKKTCALDRVDDATLRCSNGSSQYSFERAEVKSVKLARRGRSTLLGAAIGLGAGAVVGAIGGATQEGKNPEFPGLATGVYAAIGGAAGGILGASIGGPTDFLRGPTLYVR